MNPNLHSHFFKSLKQVEKRLKSEQTNNNTQQESLTSSPLYLNFQEPTTTTNSENQESEPPQQFLTNSLDFPPNQETPPQEIPLKKGPEKVTNEFETNGVEDIEMLMQLLGLSGCGNEEGVVGLDLDLDLESDCDDGFFVNVAKVKGPKCKKEVERLEGWIRHFMNSEGERKQPFVLAHLLLAKAALVQENCGGFEFPETVVEFLQNDPPPN